MCADRPAPADPPLTGIAGLCILTSHKGVASPERTAIICATYEWMEVFIPELKVMGIIFEYDDVEEDKERALRPLCIATRMYLDGEGRIEQKRHYFAGARFQPCTST